MSDQCENCSYRGDLAACRAAECSKHEDWYPMQLQQELDDLKASTPRIKADAVREALVLFGSIDGYNAVDLADHLEEYANQLEQGDTE